MPQACDGEILVRNHAIAANPIDWKIQEYGIAIKNYPTVLGSDVSGVVAAVGPGVTKFKVGDRVAGFAGVVYKDDADHGAWQTYTILREIATMPIPASLSFEEAATFPMAFATSGIAIFASLQIPRPVGGVVKPQESSFLVWGGSSSIGTAAIQLAKNLGFNVFTTASPKNYDQVQSLGAVGIFDYRDPEVVSKITAAAEAAGTPIRFGFDAITEGNSSLLSASILLASSGKGSKLVLSYEWPSSYEKLQEIEILQTAAFRTGTDQVELGQWLFNEYLPREVQKKNIVPAPKIEVVDGGIWAVQKVFDQLKAGVSGSKLVVRVD
jgi:NADPH:quinone reductase-like Zn-dependent oxidoreductase